MLKKIKLGKRSGLKCMVCFEQISEAIEFSCNGHVPIADGIRCDGKRELMKVVDLCIVRLIMSLVKLTRLSVYG
jgi:hypothetical protein